MDIRPIGQNFLDLYNNESDTSKGSKSGGGTTSTGGEGEENPSLTEPDESDAFMGESWPTAPPMDYLETLKGYESTSFDAVSVPPLPWEIEEAPTQAFKDEVRLVAVPNTTSIKCCHRCRGSGGVTCRDCNGKGWSRCLNCHGDGWLASDHGGGGGGGGGAGGSGGGHGGGGGGGHGRERCFYCQHSKHGHGQQDCSKCQTKGKVNCATCEGHGQIRCYIQLSITWKVHTAEHIVEKLNLPTELIRDVSGQVAYEEEAPSILPLTVVSDAAIKDASSSLVNKHVNTFSDQRIVRQRHQVRVVPVTHVLYEWNNKTFSFYVYGYENKVFLRKYPQQCCWGCSIV